jgi:hypothetical protein
MVLKRQVVSLWSKLGASPNTVHLMGFGKSIRNLIRRTPLTRLRAEADVVHGSPLPLRRGRRPGPPRLEKAPVAVHPLPQGGEGCEFELRLTVALLVERRVNSYYFPPSHFWGRGGVNSNCFSPSAAAAAEGSEFGLPPPLDRRGDRRAGGGNCEL